MPPPAFGIQLVYEDLNEPEYLGPVFENDAVVIKRGYHPNVAIPGHSLNFLWLMATLEPGMERTWAGVNTQPEFAKEQRLNDWASETTRRIGIDLCLTNVTLR